MRAVMLEVPQALLDERRAKPVHIRALDVRAETVDGARRLTWDGGSARI